MKKVVLSLLSIIVLTVGLQGASKEERLKRFQEKKDFILNNTNNQISLFQEKKECIEKTKMHKEISQCNKSFKEKKKEISNKLKEKRRTMKEAKMKLKKEKQKMKDSKPSVE